MGDKYLLGLYAGAPVCYHSLNGDGVIVDVNQKWLETTGYERNDIVGVKFTELLHSEIAEIFHRLFPAYLAKGYTKDTVFDVKKADGSFIRLRGDSYITYDDNGNCLQSHAVFLPVESQKPSYSQIFKTASVPMLVYDAATKDIIDANEAACRFYKYDYTVLTSLTLSDISDYDEQQLKSNIYEVISNKSRESFVFRHKLSDGTLKTVDVRPTPISMNNKMYVCSLITDITDKICADQRIRSMAVLSAKLLSPDLEVTEIVDVIKDFSKSLTGAQYCYVSILDDDREMLEVKGISGRNYVIEKNASGWSSIFNNCLNTLNIFFSSNIDMDRLEKGIPEWHRGEHNLMMCPVFLDKELVGHISLADCPEGFTGYDAETIDEIAKLYALAVKGLRERRIEALFQTVFDNTADGVAIYISDGDGDFIFKSLNKAGLAISGFELSDVLGRKLTEVYPGFIDAPLLRTFNKVWETGEPMNHPVMKYEDDSHCLWVENYVFKIYNKYLVAIYRDVSRLMETNRALEESESKYRSYVENSPDPIIVINRQLLIVDANTAAIEKFEYPMEEIKTRKIYELWPEELQEQFVKNIGINANKVKKGFEVLHQYISKSGKLFDMHVHVKILPNGLMVGVLQDLTERIRMENELSELNTNLQKRVEEEIAIREKQERMLFEQKKLADMGQMINAIAHQWRQPINVLGLYTQSIYDDYHSGNLTREDMDDFRSDTLSMIMHMSKTIDDFRDFYKPDKEKVEFSIVQEIINLLNLIDAQLAVKNVNVSVKCKCGTETECINLGKGHQCFLGHVDIIGYPGEFKQAVINIINNAVDSIQENMDAGIIARGEIEVLVEAVKNSIKIRISDNGTGIPKNVLSKIYDPYFSTKGEGKGTGIGLYMTKLVIEKHMGGVIKAGNKKNGAYMEIKFPIKV